VKECPACGRCFDRSDEVCPDDRSELSLTLPVERVLEDRYRLERVLGRGGMGIVYKARQKTLDRLVAIKVLAGERRNDPQFEARFSREARTLAKLSHPNIVAAIDVGESEGFYYFAMEFVDGESLKDVLIRDGKLPEKRALEITRAMASALEHAHEQNIVHRDIKPGNIMIEGSSGDPVILDFGLARADEGEFQTLTRTGDVFGTPAYMSPEQVLGEARRIDRRSDIYSLGATLYECLTARRPFEAPTQASTSYPSCSQ